MGYSQARDRQDGNWVDKTTCHGDPCKLYFFIVIDDQVHQAIENARSNAGCGNNCTFRIKVNAPGNVDAGNARLYLFSLRRVQAFLRSYSIIADISDSNLISYMSNTLDLSLTEGDVETAYIGSQIVAKGMSINVNTGKQRSMYFISPVVIPYPMNVPGQNSSVSLPLDRVLRTAVFELALKDFNWDKAVKLIDWLWSKHRDSVFKLLLSKPVVDSLIVLALGGYRYVRGLYALESSVLMELYGNRIITYSPSIGKIARAYYRVRNNVAADILDVVKDLLVELSDGELKNSDLNNLQSDEVKRLLSVFALIYGLHGISHLLMKALTILTGLTDYGERIEVSVDTNSLRNNGFNTLIDALERVGGNGELVHEGLYSIKAGEYFEPRVYLFSRLPFSFSTYRDILARNINGGQTLNIDLLRDSLTKLLVRDGDDSCERRWRVERTLLMPHRQALMNDQQLNRADNLIGTSLGQMFRPPRSIFRFVYEYHLVYDILDNVVGVSSSQNRAARRDFWKRLNTHVQYIWPYHLPQCVDGCYGCVLIERGVRVNTCELTPLAQELRISKWAALCLLKYAGGLRLF